MTAFDEYLKAVEILKKANDYENGHGRSEIYHYEEQELNRRIIIYDVMIYKEELKQMNYKYIMPKDVDSIIIQF